MSKSGVSLVCICLSATAILSLASAAFPQGSGSSRVAPAPAARPAPVTREEFYQTFWKHIVRREAPYNTWPVLAKRDVPPRKESPHGVSTTYANKIAAADTKALPAGSILVREDYDDKGKRTSISVMYRIKGTDPQNGDWYWLRYLESGSIARTSPKDGNKAIAGKVASCTECHRKAPGKDFVFATDVTVSLLGPGVGANGLIHHTSEQLSERTSSDDAIQPLLRQRLAILRELVTVTKSAYQMGETGFAEVATATRLVIGAELELCDTDNERLALYKKAVALAKDNEGMATRSYQAGQATQASVLAAKANRLDAEIAFERAKAKVAATSK